MDQQRQVLRRFCSHLFAAWLLENVFVKREKIFLIMFIFVALLFPDYCKEVGLFFELKIKFQVCSAITTE